ncbi:MAG: protein kinase [Nannocystis sp.]|nr:protein kinase [Nannocystis sp.]MBA3549417.1 protein kinase [Nannocystis sp.]
MVDDEPASGTILIVEDHQDTRETLRDYLEEFGHIVDVAVDGADGLRKVQDRDIDLVITDLNMPHVSGLELLAAIKSHKLTPDVLVLSATGLISKAVEAMRLGAVNYLVKPVDLDQLTSEVRAVMRARRHRDLQKSAGQTTVMLDNPPGEPTRPQMVLDHETGKPLPLSKSVAGEPEADTDAGAESDTPTMIGRYQVLGELGAGGMGTVYKCFDPALRRTVAVKVVTTGAIRRVHRELLLQRFSREAQAAGMLNHPNIVTIFDYHEDPRSRSVYLAMEYVSGQSLGAVIAQAGKLPWPRATLLAFQIMDALEYAHRSHIIHRDVKPENVLVTDGDVAKILDFGIAKLADSELTRPGTFVGSPRYLAPESFRGGGIDYRTDQFSLGTVFFEMLTGVPAFKFEDFYAGVHRILSEVPPPLASHGVIGPPKLQEIMTRLHQKDPDRRYIDEMELLGDLAELGALAGLNLQVGVARTSPTPTPTRSGR